MSVTMPIEQKVAIAREFVTRVFNEHQPDRATEYFSADAVWHGGSLGNIAGRDNVVNLLRVFIGALPDLNAVEEAVNRKRRSCRDPAGCHRDTQRRPVGHSRVGPPCFMGRGRYLQSN